MASTTTPYEELAHQSERSDKTIELKLWGIEKTWVRSPKGEWMDKEKLQLAVAEPDLSQHDEQEEIPKRRRWWQFGKK